MTHVPGSEHGAITGDPLRDAKLFSVPTVVVIEGFRFFFFSNEGNEPPHIHVEKGEGYAKFWLQPVELVYAEGFKRPQFGRMQDLAEENVALFLEKWNEYFGS